MAANNWLFGCMRCYITPSSDNVTMINTYNSSAIHTSGVVLINSRNYVVNNDHIGWTIINDGRYIPTLWDEPSVSAPITVDGDYSVYLVDTTLADANFLWDIEALEGCSVTLKVIAGANNIVIQTATNAELFEFAAMPYTITPSIGDSYTIFSNGTDLFII